MIVTHAGGETGARAPQEKLLDETLALVTGMTREISETSRAFRIAGRGGIKDRLDLGQAGLEETWPPGIPSGRESKILASCFNIHINV